MPVGASPARWSSARDPGKLPAIAARKRPTDRRERLLAVGVREFALGDYSKVSTERIAEQAGVAQGLLFHYFKTKLRFWEEVVSRVFEEQEAAFTANTHRDPVRWLREELELFLFGLTEYPPSLMTAGPGFNADHRAIVETRQERAAARLVQRMGITEPSPLLSVAVRGWVGLSLSAGRRWLETPAVTRAQILSLITEALHATLKQVDLLDPGAVDPVFFCPPGSVTPRTGSRGVGGDAEGQRLGRSRARLTPDS